MALTTGQNETDFASIEREPLLPTLIVFQSQTQGSLCNVSKSQTHVGSDRRGLPVNLCLKKCDSYLQVSCYNVLLLHTQGNFLVQSSRAPSPGPQIT